MTDDVFCIGVEKEVTWKITSGDIEATYYADGEIVFKLLEMEWFESHRNCVSSLLAALQELQKIIAEEKQDET